MSKRTWIKEFYPKPANKVSKAAAYACLASLCQVPDGAV